MKNLILLIALFALLSSCKKEADSPFNGRISQFYSIKDNCFVNFFYNSDQNIVKMVCSATNSKLSAKYVLTYNSEKQLKRMDFYGIEGALTTYNLYNYSHDTIRSEIYKKENDEFKLVGKQLFLINFQDSFIKKIYSIDFLSDELHGVEKYIWEKGNLIKIEGYDDDRDTTGNILAEFEYDDKINPLHELSIKSVIESLNTNFNFSHNNPIKFKRYVKSIDYRYNYNKNGFPVSGIATITTEEDTIQKNLLFEYY